MRAGFTVLFLLLLVNFASAAVVINEVMYNPLGSSETNHEWIELYNNGLQSENLANWLLYESNSNKALTLASGSDYNLPAGSYAIITENATIFQADYPAFAGLIFNSDFTGGLSNSGEFIGLNNSDENVLEAVNYTGWNIAPDGYSMEKKNSSLDNNNISNWRLGNPGGTPGASNEVVPVLGAIQDQSVNESNLLILNITAFDSDPEDNLTYFIVGYPPVDLNLTKINSNLSVLTWTPGYGFVIHPNSSNTLNITVNVTDTKSSNQKMFTVNVSDINQNPIATTHNLSTDVNTPISILLLNSSPTDDDGDNLSINTTNGTNGTTFVIGDNVTYVPQTDFYGTDSFNYTIIDGFGGLATATVTVIVNQVNSAPTAQNQTTTTDEDAFKSIILNASDPENGPLNWSILTLPQNGNLTGTAPNLTYIPSLNVNGQDNFTFKVIDNQGTESNIATISITITPVNDAPTTAGNTYNISEDNSINIIFNAFDIDSSTLNYTAVAPTHGTLTGTGSNLTYTPAADYNGVDSFTFTAKDDANLESNTATITINIAPVNDAPVAANQTTTLDEDTFKDITLSATDIDGSQLNYSVATNPAHGTFNGTRYTPAANYNGTDSFTFQAADGTLSSTGIIILAINQVNDAPNITSTAPREATQSVTLSYLVQATDVENDNRSIDLQASTFGEESFSGNVQIKINGLQVNFTSQNAGSIPVKIVVTDGTDSATQEFNLTVVPVLDFAQLRIGKGSDLVSYEAGASTDAFNPLDNLTFQLAVQNRYIASGAYITKIEIGTEQDILTDFPAVDLEKTYLNPQEIETTVFSYQIPYNLDDGNYTLTFSVSGTDLSNRTYTTERIVYLIVTRIPHSLTITEVTADAQVICEQKQDVALVITVANTGTYDEDVNLTVKNTEFNVSSSLQETIAKKRASEFTFRLDLQQVVGEIAFTIEAAKADLPIPEYQSVRTIRIVADNCVPEFQNLANTITLTEDQPLTVNLTSNLINLEASQPITISVSQAQNITSIVRGKMVTFTPLANWFGESKANITVSDGINSTRQEIRIIINQNTTDDSPVLTNVSTIPTLLKYNAELVTINTTIQNPDQQSPTYEWFINNTKQTADTSSFSFSGTSLGVGSHTIKLLFNNQTERTWATQVADRPVDAHSFNVNANGDITNLANFTLSNTYGGITFLENVDLTNILRLADIVSIDTNKVTINSATAPALNKPARITLHGQFTSPIVMKSDDGNTFTVCPETECQIISNSDGAVTFTVAHFSTYSLQEAASLLLSVTSTEIKPRTSNDVKVKVTNTYSQKVEDIVVTARLLDVDGDELEEESKEFSLSPQASKEVTIEFDLTAETLDEDSYILEVSAESSADSEQVGRTTKVLQVKRQSHEIIIRSLELSSDSLECSGLTSLRVTLENLGTRDEDKIGISVQNAALRINLARSNLELDDYSGAAERNIDFNFNLDKAVNGQYPITVAVFRDGHLETSKDITLTVNCPITTETAQTQVQTYSAPVESITLPSYYQPMQTRETPIETTPVKTTFRDSDTYLTLIGTMIVLLFLAIVLGLVVLMKKRS